MDKDLELLKKDAGVLLAGLQSQAAPTEGLQTAESEAQAIQKWVWPPQPELHRLPVA